MKYIKKASSVAARQYTDDESGMTRRQIIGMTIDRPYTSARFRMIDSRLCLVESNGEFYEIEKNAWCIVDAEGALSVLPNEEFKRKYEQVEK